MPEPRKFRIMFATFSYGGNGGTASCHPDTRDWLIRTIAKAKADPRVSAVCQWEMADTPITMTRNRAVLDALEAGADALIMLDSDMRPDCEPDGKPFWDTSFDFFCAMYDKHPVVIGAPYCGGSGAGGVENVYVFRWENCLRDNPDECDMQLKPFSRVEAAMHAGIQEVGALPTGLIWYDCRVFRDLLDPMPRYLELRNLGLTDAEACKAAPHYFSYEWTSPFASDKASTEDVQNTRDISLAGIAKYGANPVYCNWDAWAGHWKPKLVRKPQILSTDSVASTLINVARRGNESGVKIEHVDFRRPKPEIVVNTQRYDPHGVSTESHVVQSQAVTKAADQTPVSRPLSDPSSGEAVQKRWQAWQETQRLSASAAEVPV